MTNNTARPGQAKWICHCVEQYISAYAERAANLYEWYVQIAHNIAEATPVELREFLEEFDFRSVDSLRDLFALAWRIVGNEFRDDPVPVSRAAVALFFLCESDDARRGFAPIPWGDLDKKLADDAITWVTRFTN